MILEFSLMMSAIWWVGARATAVFTNFGRVNGLEPWQKAFVDLTTPFVFGLGFLYLSWNHELAHFAHGEVLLWALALTPFAIYFYLAWRFAAWRWRRRTDRSQPLTFTLKPTTPVAWVVYIWFGAWVAWQLCHAFAPALLPHWLS